MKPLKGLYEKWLTGVRPLELALETCFNWPEETGGMVVLIKKRENLIEFTLCFHVTI
jgi:hypothetical protein